MHGIPESIEANLTLDKKGKLHFPVILVFPEFHTIELIQDWPEDQKVKDALGPIFKDKAPWDHEGIYRLDCIEIYFEAD